MIEVIDGNLLSTACKIIAHQVNCKGLMDHGVAKQLRDKYPRNYRIYKEVCSGAEALGTPEKLLGINLGVVEGDKIIVNMFAQLNRGTGKQTDYKALRECFEDVKSTAISQFPLSAVAMPYKIGCGLGGGDWDEVYSILKEVFEKSPVTCKLYRMERNEQYEEHLELKDRFIERTKRHVALVNKYAARAGSEFPNHDKDKLGKNMVEGYMHILNPNRTKEEEELLDRVTFAHVTLSSHHPEYWTSTDLSGFTRKNFCPNGTVDATKMSCRALVEMTADWCAMSEEFGNTPYEWFDKVLNTRWKFDPEQVMFIEYLIEKMWDVSEN